MKPDAAIVVFGEGPYAEYEGDRETLDFSGQDQGPLTLLRTLRLRGIPTVAVLLSGRPLWVNPEINASDAFVAAWLPGSQGEGIADLLLRGAHGERRFDFTGHLGFPWPNTAMPVTDDAADRTAGALFERGYGLSFTRWPHRTPVRGPAGRHGSRRAGQSLSGRARNRAMVAVCIRRARPGAYHGCRAAQPGGRRARCDCRLAAPSHVVRRGQG